MGTRGPQPGTRVGGRQKGTPNKRSQQLIEAVAETGISPLDYLLQVMRNPTGDAAVRLEAAKAAAPYVHPKLSAIEHSSDPDKPLSKITRIELVAASKEEAMEELMESLNGTSRCLPSERH